MCFSKKKKEKIIMKKKKIKKYTLDDIELP